MFVFPQDGRLAAAVVATEGVGRQLPSLLQPFSSRAGMPDWVLWSNDGVQAGFFDAQWRYDQALQDP
jgi:hypothetical protein